MVENVVVVSVISLLFVVVLAHQLVFINTIEIFAYISLFVVFIVEMVE